MNLTLDKGNSHNIPSDLAVPEWFKCLGERIKSSRSRFGYTVWGGYDPKGDAERHH